MTSIQLADLIADELGNVTFSVSAVFRREFLPRHDVAQNEVVVSILPRSIYDSDLARDYKTRKIVIELIVRKKVESETEVESMIEFVEDVIDQIQIIDLPDQCHALSVYSDPVYLLEYLESHRMFIASINAEFELVM